MNSAYLVTALLDDAFSLSRLPAELRAKSDSLPAARRQQWLAGRALLAEALAALYGGDMLPAMQLSAQGKPSFTDPSLPHFSLSHSKSHLQLVLCAAAETGGDVEQIRPRPRYLAVAKEAFTSAECQWLAEQPDPVTAFWQLWCLREAWLKQQGGSVWQMDRIRPDPVAGKYTSEPFTDSLLWVAGDDAVMRALALPARVTEVKEWVFNAASGTLQPQAPRQWLRFSPR